MSFSPSLLDRLVMKRPSHETVNIWSSAQISGPFFGPGGRRAVQAEVEAAFAAQTGCLPVEGFMKMVDAGEAVAGQTRVAGFMEMSDRREWLLTASASRGMEWESAPVPSGNYSRVSLVLAVGFGNGSPLPQPTGAWDFYVNDRYALTVRVVYHSQLWRGLEASFAFSASRIESAEPYHSLYLSSLITQESRAAFGPALLTLPAAWFPAGQPARIRLVPKTEVSTTQWIQLFPSRAVLQQSRWQPLAEMLTGRSRPRIGDYQVFFGDIHTHSGEVDGQTETAGCGWGSRENNYAYARGPGGLDFYALTEHEWQVDPARADVYLGLANRYNEDHRFVCLPAFEYTNPLYGHRNVYFRSSDGALFNARRPWGPPSQDPTQCYTPQDLWTAMEKTGVPFLTVPHHPSAASHPLNLDFYHPRHDRLYEIYSCWGSSEFLGDFPRGVADRHPLNDFREAMRRGQRYGVIASSDSHDGHPGNAQSPLVKHHHLFHFCGSGRAVVLAPELTRVAVFDALYARRCYATTGVPILLDVRLNGAVMGNEVPLPAGRRPRLTIHCEGSNGLRQVRLIRNGVPVHTWEIDGQQTCDLEWEDSAAPETGTSYYVRVVQVDRESAWSSPLWAK
jgi:hypothetical protein